MTAISSGTISAGFSCRGSSRVSGCEKRRHPPETPCTLPSDKPIATCPPKRFIRLRSSKSSVSTHSLDTASPPGTPLLPAKARATPLICENRYPAERDVSMFPITNGTAADRDTEETDSGISPSERRRYSPARPPAPHDLSSTE